MARPPEKQRARLGTGLRKDLNDAAEYHGCAHGATITHPMPQGHAHYAAERCAACDAFLRWLPKPPSVARRRFNAFRLARLSMTEGLSKWEWRFLKGIEAQKKLSPKQQAVLDGLVAQHLEAKAP